VSARRLRLRCPAACSVCRCDLPRGSDAFWDSEAKLATCLVCGSGGDLARELAGTAGGSGRRTYERRRDRREGEVRGLLGNRLGGLYLFFKQEPQSTKAWLTGADGEERRARFLETELPFDAIGLHDRRIPGTQTNIDHVIVARGGVWVVDAKDYKGRVEQRDIGPLWRFEPRLFVGGRDRTKLVAAMHRQLRAVSDAVAGDPLASELTIRASVCFVASSWGFHPKAFELDGVLVCWPQHLAQRIARPGTLTKTSVERMANRIAVALPAS
jgi:Nuclease-related domain